MDCSTTSRSKTTSSLLPKRDFGAMPAGTVPKVRCLWRADDGRCASCKARRIKNDVLHQSDYEMCVVDRDYPGCEFYKERPTVMNKR